MRLLLFTIYLVTLPLFIQSQSLWSRFYGDIESSGFTDLYPTLDGGYIATGWVVDYGPSDLTNYKSNIYVVKTDSSGFMQWQRVFGTINRDVGKSVVQVANGDIFILGTQYQNLTAHQILLIKLDQNGNELWTQSLGGVNHDIAGGLVAVGNDVVITATANVISNSLQGGSLWLFKVSNSGAILWDKTYSSAAAIRGNGICKVHDGGFLISGSYGTPNGTQIDYTGYIVRTNSTGDTLWSRIIDTIGVSTTPTYAQLESCVELSDNNYFAITGITRATTWGKMCAIVVDLNGNPVQTFISTGIAESGNKITALPNNEFIIAGDWSNFGSYASIYKFYGYLGFPGWSWAYNRYYNMAGSSYFAYSSSAAIVPHPVEGYVVAGYTSLNGSDYNKSRAMLYRINDDLQSGAELNIQPTASVINLCYGDSSLISVPDLYDHYQWFRYDSLSRVIWVQNSDTSALTVFTGKSYRCFMWNENGDNALSKLVVAYVSYVPSNEITLGGNIASCNPSFNLSVANQQGNSYVWFLNGNQLLNTNSYSLYVSTSGSYTVQITNVCTTLTTNPVQVSLTGPPILDPGPDTLYVANTNVVCLAQPFTVPFISGTTYQWYYNGVLQPGNSNNFTAYHNGYYYLIANTPCGIYNSDTTWLIYNFQPRKLIYYTGTLTACANPTTTIRAPFTSGNAFFEWYFNGAMVSSGFYIDGYDVFRPGYLTTGIDSGFIYCKVSDVCQFNTDTVFFRESQNSLNVSFVTGSNLNCSFNPITIKATENGGQYQWYNDTTPIAGATQQQYLVAITGLYTCRITKPCGDYFTSLTYVYIGGPTKTIISDASTICISNTDTVTVKLSISPYSGYANYQWRLNGNNIPGATSNYYNTKTAGLFDCLINSTCGLDSSNTINLQYNSIPNGITVDNYNKLCPGGIVTAHAPPGYTYQWYQRPFFTDILIPGATDSLYNCDTTSFFYVKISNGLCSVKSGNFQITAQTPPSPVTIFNWSPIQYCGNDTITLEANSRSDYSYQWYHNGAVVPGATNYLYESSATGNFSVMITDSAQCTSLSNPVQVNNSTLNNVYLSVPTISNQCQGDTITVTVLGNYASYQWLYNHIAIPGATAQSYTTDSTGYYSVQATNNSGCWGEVGTQLTFVPAPVVSNITMNPANCPTSPSGSVIVTFSTTVNLLWTANGTITVLNGITSHTKNGLLPGWYHFTYSIPGAACSFSDSVLVTSNSNLNVQINAGSGVFCIGNTINAGVNNSNYLWSTGQTSYSIIPQVSGIYTVTITDNYGCTGTDTAAVIVNPLPSVNMQASANGTTCNGSLVQLNAGSGFNSYLWSTGQTSQTINVYSAGNYIVTVVNSNNCLNKDTLTVLNGTIPTVVASAVGPTTFCVGDSVLIQVNNWTNGTYQWYRSLLPIQGSTGTSFYAKSNGEFRCFVTDASGCFAFTNSIFVYTPCMPPQDPIQKQIAEAGDNSSIVTIYPNPGTGIYEIKFEGDDALAEFILYDMSGRVVDGSYLLKLTQPNLLKFDISDKVSGIYFLKIIGLSGKVYRGLVVKE